MIEPMIKYDILLYHKEFDTFLKALQEKGLLDVALADPKLACAHEKDYLYGLRAMQLIKKLKDWAKCEEGNKDKGYTCSKDVDVTGIANDYQLIEWAEKAIESEKKTKEKKAALEKIEERDSVWGDFDPVVISRLREGGVSISFGSCNEKQLPKGAEQKYPISVVGRRSGVAYFVIYGEIIRDESSEKFSYDKESEPTYSFSQIGQQKSILEKELSTFCSKIRYASDNVSLYEQVRDRWLTNLNFNIAKTQSSSEAEGCLKIVEGYLPLKNKAEFENFLNEEAVFFECRAGKELTTEDLSTVPVLLKNNAFTKLFEPITLLFSLPSYRELDLTPLFAPFFMMFFGFCMGDAGYGLLFVLVGLLLKKKVKPSMKPMLSLVCYLGLAAVVFGTLTGTVFGYSLVQWEALQNIRSLFFDQNKMMALSLFLGAIQILFGMMIKVFNMAKQDGFKYSIGFLGWWLIIVAAIPLLLPMLEMGELPIIIKYMCYSVVGIGLLMAFLYNNPDRPWWSNIGSGLWNSYNIATGLVGDLLSYIRLFALGLTGGILGSVFNDLAFQMSGSIPVVKQIVILLILLLGHSLNIALCTLGSVVHPLRLTFVEFYKNAGFAGGGRAYNPFKIEK